MSGKDDPYARFDTRSFLGKTDRRDSHRSTVEAKVAVDDGGEDLTMKMVLSLNGLFAHKEDVARDLELKKVVVTLAAFDEEGDLRIEGITRRTTGGRGFVLPCEDVDFEISRRIARYLDQHTDEQS